MPGRAEPASGVPAVVRVDDAAQAAALVAREISELVRERRAAGRSAVLGLATGRSQEGVYRELVRLHRAREVSFATAVVFQLDEYLGLAADHPGTLRAWLRARFLDQVDLPRESVHAPASDLDPAQVALHCRSYEQRIAEAGGIDLQLLGVGRNGHVAFNEPGSARDSRTRRVELDPVTREHVAASFGGLERVPFHALTLGVGTLLEARRIRVLAFGEEKREVARRVVAGPVASDVPATFLRGHGDVRLYLDREASA